MKIEQCNLCPRRCGARRDETGGGGFCRMGTTPVVARAALHFWEEPCLSGQGGAGAVFFSGCPLGCAFCQNEKLSAKRFGKTVEPADLRRIFDRLIGQGAQNINLVTGTHFVPALLEALAEPLPVPVVWNSGGYEEVETLRRLEGMVQIYLPDYKFALPGVARALAGAPDYPEKAEQALLEMYRQVGDCRFDEDGRLQSGMVTRHLVLPGRLQNTYRALDLLARLFKDKGVWISLMSQYTPAGRAAEFPHLDRRLLAEEYEAALCYMGELGLEKGYIQELSSAKEEYVPPFDLTGLEE